MKLSEVFAEIDRHDPKKPFFLPFEQRSVVIWRSVGIDGNGEIQYERVGEIIESRYMPIKEY